MDSEKDITVVALGGSIVVPGDIDTAFLKRLRSFLIPYIESGHTFILVVGGGAITRIYQDAASEVVDVSDEDKDLIGIHMTRTNAQLLRTIFADYAHPDVLDDPHKPILETELVKYRLFIGAGGKPGHSTDYDTAVLAHRFGANKFLIATATPYVYTKDFKKYPDAEPIKELSWSTYCSLISTDWAPGLKAPVDPVAARFAQEHGMHAQLIQGTNLKNFRNYIEGGMCEGTVIHP